MSALADLLRYPADDPSELARRDPRATPGFEGAKADAVAAMPALLTELGTLQGQLFAQGYVALPT